MGGVLITFNNPVEVGAPFPIPIGFSVSKIYAGPDGQICSNATSNTVPNAVFDAVANYFLSDHPNFPSNVQAANTGLNLINAVGGPIDY